MKLKEVFAQEKPFFMFSISLIWQIIFFYIPILFILVLSLIKISEVGEYSFSFSNFLFFLNSSYGYVILQSLFLGLGTVCLCFLIGFPIAHFISFKSGRFKIVFLFLLILPFWTNFLLHVYSWFYILEKTGFLNNFLLWLGIIREPMEFLNSFGAVLTVMVYCYLPFMVLPIYSVLERIDKNVLEASADLGARTFQTWFRVLLPLAATGIQSGFFLVFIPAFGEFAIPGLVGGEKYMFVGSVITRYILGTKTISHGAAFTLISCICLILFLITLYVIVHKFFRRYV